MNNHYRYLYKAMWPFIDALGIHEGAEQSASGLITAHGDKAYSYEGGWKEKGIPFCHGVAIYLISYLAPYDKEVRETKDGWVAPQKWVEDNYHAGHKFGEILQNLDKTLN